MLRGIDVLSARSVESSAGTVATGVSGLRFGLVKGTVRAVARLLLPEETRRRFWKWRKRRASRRRPPVGRVRFGSFRRLEPIARDYGLRWGEPIDRYYIEKFLESHGADIRGVVLEVADRGYTEKYGQGVTRSEVLHAGEGNPKATIIGDLTSADHIPDATFDCVILTQTLMYIYDLGSAVRTLYRILKPGGSVLVTVAGTSQINRYELERWGEYWRFTEQSSRRLFSEVFGEEQVEVEVFGNVLSCVGFLQGLVREELRRAELDYLDPEYPLIVAVRAVRVEA